MKPLHQIPSVPAKEPEDPFDVEKLRFLSPEARDGIRKFRESLKNNPHSQKKWSEFLADLEKSFQELQKTDEAFAPGEYEEFVRGIEEARAKSKPFSPVNPNGSKR